VDVADNRDPDATGLEVLQHLSRVWVGPCRSEGAVALPDREHQLAIEASSAQLEQRER
jgi:hypothetical protein